MEDSFASRIRLCGEGKNVEQGVKLHVEIRRTGLDRQTYIGNLLVQMYGKLGRSHDARKVFDRIYHPNVFSWNIMMGAYVQNENYEEVLDLFHVMLGSGGAASPNHITYMGLLGACSSLEALEDGREIHSRIAACGLDNLHVILANSLVNMYGKCGSVEEAEGVFAKMSRRDTGSWNALMAAYVQNGNDTKALEIYRTMDVAPDRITYTTVLTACSGSLESVREIHRDIFSTRFNSDTAVLTALLNVYGKTNSLADARELFENIRVKSVVTWTAMIGSCMHSGCPEEALKLSRRMSLEGVKPNKVTFTCILDACSDAGSLAEGKLVHENLQTEGLEEDAVVATALIDMYGKCERPDEAADVFTRLSSDKLVPWNAMLAAYSRNGYSREARELFCTMDQEGIKKDMLSFLNTLESFRQLPEAKLVHARIVEAGFALELSMGNAIVNMYGRCGSLLLAKSTFDELKRRDVISWTSIIAAYSQQGLYKKAQRLLCEMHLEGVKANEITFVNMLYAFRHAGLVREGCLCFYSMIYDHDVPATGELYGCMVDLFGRAGWLVEAQDMIHAMPVQPDAVSWTSLLNACNIHYDKSRALHAAERVQRLEVKDMAAPYVALSNIYLAEHS